jgi:hypothetical protein
MTIDERVRDALRDADAHMPAADLDNLGRQLARDFDALAEPMPGPLHPPRTRARVLIAVSIAAAILAALVGLFTLTRDRSSTPNIDVQPTSTTSAPLVGPPDITAFAQQLLERATLPPGASVTTASPPDVLGAPPSPMVKTQVDPHRLFSVPMSAEAVAAFVETHTTPGTRASGPGHGSLSIRGVKALLIEQDALATPGDVIESAELYYAVTSSGPSTSTLRVDALVVWGPHHPHIPARDKVVTVTGTLDYPVGKSKTVVLTDAGSVAESVKAFEQALIMGDGPHGCPPAEPHPSLITFSFATSRTAQPDVVLKVEDTGCRIADVRIDGHGAPAIYGGGLIDVARIVLQR